MNILLLGPNGQVGFELRRTLTSLGTVFAIDRHGQDGLTGDLSDQDGLIRTIQEIRPSIIVNAAAYTAVDKAESETESARQINAVAPGILAEQAQILGALLVHYSTDYVFNGTGNRAWQESDQPEPLNIYGRTKLEGEQAIRNVGCRHLIFRTAWVYAARGHNFLRTMLRLASERNALEVVDDQVGTPTSAALIAESTTRAIRAAESDPAVEGLYHLTPTGETTWYGYAKFVIETARDAGWPVMVKNHAIVPVPTTAFPTPARRPRNSRMDCDKFMHTFEVSLPDWRAGIKQVLAEVIKTDEQDK